MKVIDEANEEYGNVAMGTHLIFTWISFSKFNEKFSIVTPFFSLSISLFPSDPEYLYVRFLVRGEKYPFFMTLY